MEWLSQEEIKRRAEISDEEALNVSIEHWEQICEAVKADIRVHGHYGDEECALCHLYLSPAKHSNCILYEKSSKRCCQEWLNFFDNHTLENARAMLNRLYLERGKRYGKETKEVCKKEEPSAIRHGDYGYDLGSYCQPEERLFLTEYKGDTIRAVNKNADGHYITSGCNPVVLGNIFDDLKMYAEDLEEFEVAHSPRGNNWYGRLDKDGHDPNAVISLESRGVWCSLDKAQELHQKLGQLIATARRQAKKKDCQSS